MSRKLRLVNESNSKGDEDYIIRHREKMWNLELQKWVPIPGQDWTETLIKPGESIRLDVDICDYEIIPATTEDALALTPWGTSWNNRPGDRYIHRPKRL